MKYVKLPIAAIWAAAMLAAVVGTASARNLSTSSQRLRATFTNIEFSGGFGTAKCNVTLEGSFHSRTIAKVLGSLRGFVTGATVSGCAQGSATLLRETLPWHQWYLNFTGTLPNITSIGATIIGVAFDIREPVFGIECLARSTASSPVTSQFNRETATRVMTSAVVAGTIPTSCGLNGTLRGTSNSLTTGPGTTTRITITLI